MAQKRISVALRGRWYNAEGLNPDGIGVELNRTVITTSEVGRTIAWELAHPPLGARRLVLDIAVAEAGIPRGDKVCRQ